MVKKKQDLTDEQKLAEHLNMMSKSVQDLTEWQHAVLQNRILERAMGADKVAFYLVMVHLNGGKPVEKLTKELLEEASAEVVRISKLYDEFNDENSPAEAEVVEKPKRVKVKKKK